MNENKEATGSGPDCQIVEHLVSLLPCPFCGCSSVEIDIHDKDGWWEPGVTCGDCGIGVYPGLFGGEIAVDSVEEIMINSWNGRMIPDCCFFSGGNGCGNRR